MKNRMLGIILLVSILVSAFNFMPGDTGYVGETPPTSEDDDATGNDINPLTGLPVENPENLAVPPALISITNWPLAARPQAGLSYSPIVFELYIGEGMSRFLAMFYGDYPQEAVKNAEGNTLGTGFKAPAGNASVGPIRSGRLPYEHLRSLYNGFLVMASAYKGVAANLSATTNVIGSDADNINSAMIEVTKLEDIAKASQDKIGDTSLTGMVFDETPPKGGVDGQTLWMIYNAIDMVKWDYDKESGSYLRYQDLADGINFEQATDRLNGDPLTYENVVVLFANHRYCTETAFDVDLMYIKRSPALLFRDGEMHKIWWTTKNGTYEQTTGKVRPIRFMDENGDPLPFKPGQTWIHLMPLNTAYWETVDSDSLYYILNSREEGSGIWASRFYSSMMVFDQGVCDQVR
ncbi:MAG: DUF3048 C-terminal domain-containing protein [Anaerolineaceae bacterium]|nr:DUF3048 C-terminal domain-containing protein [Anaerolineaceae bacterium]